MVSADEVYAAAVDGVVRDELAERLCSIVVSLLAGHRLDRIAARLDRLAGFVADVADALPATAARQACAELEEVAA